jgi:hypothetical protein
MREIVVWDTKEDLESYINSSQRNDLGKDSERWHAGEYWVKHFEIRSSTIGAAGRNLTEVFYVNRETHLR